MADFLAMGGYALYVWSSFAVAAVLLGGVVAWSAIEARRVERATFARALHANRAGRGRAGTSGAPVETAGAAGSGTVPGAAEGGAP